MILLEFLLNLGEHMLSYWENINHLELSSGWELPGVGKKQIWEFWKAESLQVFVIQDIRNCSTSVLRSETEGWKGKTQVCQNALHSLTVDAYGPPALLGLRWIGIRVSRESLGLYKVSSWMWGCRIVGGQEKVPPAQGRAGSWHSSLCGHQASGIFQDFLQEVGDFDLGTKGLPFLSAEAREVLLLGREQLYLHGHPVLLNLGWIRK